MAAPASPSDGVLRLAIVTPPPWTGKLRTLLRRRPAYVPGQPGWRRVHSEVTGDGPAYEVTLSARAAP